MQESGPNTEDIIGLSDRWPFSTEDISGTENFPSPL